jgi:hypothetical protein
LGNGGLLVLDINHAASAFPNPKATAIYVGDGSRRVAWRISDTSREIGILKDAAKATLTFLGGASDQADLDRQADIIAKHWSARDVPVQSLRVAQGFATRLLICPAKSNELVIYDIVDGTLKRLKQPLMLPAGSEHTYVVMKDN